jgi:indole-3-acetate monooxygenase
MNTLLLESDQALDTLLRAHNNEHEDNRQLSAVVVDALRKADLFRQFVPASYGGPSVDPITAMESFVRLAQADAASAWCAVIGSLTSHCAGVLNADVAQQVFGDQNNIVCGAYAPSGTAIRETSAWRVNGRWAWGSGSPFANWMTGGVITDNGEFHQMLFRRSEIELFDTWHSSGLRGTGSHDFAVTDAAVDPMYTLQIGRSGPTCSDDIARMPLFPLFCAGIASVMIGIANRALEEITLLANEKKPAQSNRTLAASAVVQTDLAKAEAMIRSSTAYLQHELGTAWHTVLHGDRVSTDQRVRARLAASHIGVEMCRAVDLCYHAGGGSAVYSTSPLQRCFRDVHTAAAHIMVSTRTFETAGRHRLGLTIDPTSI